VNIDLSGDLQFNEGVFLCFVRNHDQLHRKLTYFKRATRWTSTITVVRKFTTLLSLKCHHCGRKDWMLLTMMRFGHDARASSCLISPDTPQHPPQLDHKHDVSNGDANTTTTSTATKSSKSRQQRRKRNQDTSLKVDAVTEM